MRKMGQSALDCAGGRDCFPFLFFFLCKCIMQLITYLSIFTCAFCDCATTRKLNGPGLRGQNFHSAANLVPEKGVVLGTYLIRKKWAKMCTLLQVAACFSPTRRITSLGTHSTSRGFANKMSSPTFTYLQETMSFLPFRTLF